MKFKGFSSKSSLFVGTGKTTIVKKLVNALRKENQLIVGFYTEEVRSPQNVRIGFDIVDFTGRREILAREASESSPKMPMVGKYLVHVRDFEKIALDEVRKKNESLLVLDEIGKMELLSREFTKVVERLIETLEVGGTVKLVATVPVTRIPIVERLKSLPNVRIFEVTKSNRDKLYQEIEETVREMASQVITDRK